MPSDRQTEIQARASALKAWLDLTPEQFDAALGAVPVDIEWLLAELSRVQQERDEAREAQACAEALNASALEAATDLQALRVKAEAERDALTQEIATLRQQIGDVAERLAGLQEGDSRTPDWYHAASIAEEWVRALLQKGQ